MADSRWWKDFDQVVAAWQPAGSRVLDIGCGDGGLADRLGQLGFDAIGADPAAPAHPRLIRESVEQVTDLSKVDAVVAVMALHHHAELDAVTSAISGLVRPHGRLFVYDFDWSAYDDRAAAWLVPRDPSDADNSLAGWLAGGVSTTTCTGRRRLRMRSAPNSQCHSLRSDVPIWPACWAGLIWKRPSMR